MSAQGQLRLGTSGYQYKHWRGPFYPDELRQKDWFDYYADTFDTVEINNSFYRLPDLHTFEQWKERAPKGFEYALKFSRYGSHLKRLKSPERSISQFMKAAQGLGQRRGPILVQLPPRWKANPERLDQFLCEAPKQERWVLEFRDPDWLQDAVFDVLEKHGAALCIHDMIPDHPQRLTTDWTYLRFHGHKYTGSYSNDFLAAEADRIQSWLNDGKDVYAYFNNDENAHAVHNALALKRYLTR